MKTPTNQLENRLHQLRQLHDSIPFEHVITWVYQYNEKSYPSFPSWIDYPFIRWIAKPLFDSYQKWRRQ